MRFNHSEVVTNFEGDNLKHQMSDGQIRDLTFRDLIVTALNNSMDGEVLTAETKSRCYALSTKLYSGKKFVKLTPEEQVLIKERAGTVLTQLTYGRLCDWLAGIPQSLPVEIDEDEEDSSELKE